jgi:SAM-dependent methyltransferase
MTKTTWPKTFAPLSAEQQAISDDFMKYWHEVLPRKFGIVDRFNHNYPVKHAPADFQRTLEIGAGIGEHLTYERLTPLQEANYHALELRPNMSAEIRRRFPQVRTITADCQQRIDFADGYFDRILAIHVLEHLPHLPNAVRELYRLCDKRRGVLSVVIPCEGGAAYWLARKISAERIFKKRYQQSYQWLIQREHVNRPAEIVAELAPYFQVARRQYFPLRVPAVFCNLVIGLTLTPRAEPERKEP